MNHSHEKSGPASIVVGVDGSDNSEQAFNMALGIAQRRQQAVRLVAAYTEPGYEYLPENTQGIAQENAREMLDDLIDGARDTNVPISSDAIEGDAAAVLIAESRNAELVIVGKRGRSRFAGRFLGSVSASVAAHSHCPSLIVPGGGRIQDLPEAEFAGLPEEAEIGAFASEGTVANTDFHDSVVVAVDLDAQPMEVVRAGAKHATERDLKLVLVNAQPFSGSLWIPVSPVYQAEIPDLRRNVAGRLAKFAEDAANDVGQPVDWRFFDAAPADLLADASQTASMIVVGTRGRGGFAGLLLGSVSQAALNRSVCPVLVIPTPPED